MKISGYPINSSPATSDYVLGNKASVPDTERYLLSDLITLFLNNIPAAEGGAAFVSSGLVWTADAAGSTRAATMTSGRIRVNTTFLPISAVTSRLFTASKDTYVDVLDNLDGTGTLVYTEVANNAASPALAANSTRIGIVVTGATNIASAGSINQGTLTGILPIASSIPYQMTDSIGNLVYPRNPYPGLVGYRQITSNASSSGTGHTAITGLSIPITLELGRKYRLFLFASNLVSGSANQPNISIWDGTVGSGTELNFGDGINLSSDGLGVTAAAHVIGTGSVKTFAAGVQQPSSGGATVGAGSVNPCFLEIVKE